MNIDTTLAKEFPITERFKFELRAEAYNLMNSFTGADPDLNVNSPNFGQNHRATSGRFRPSDSVQRQVRLVAGGLWLPMLLAGAVSGQYIGSKACAGCHQAQYSQQSKTGHAHALSAAAEHPLAASFPKSAAEWAFGAGEQAVTFVSRLDEDYYIEHGLTYYRSSGLWR